MSKIKVLGSEAACGTSSGNGSNFGSATAVRLVNTGTTDRLVSVETSGRIYSSAEKAAPCPCK